MTARLLGLGLLAACTTGCYEPLVEGTCAVQCGTGDQCPTGFSCAGGLCAAPGTTCTPGGDGGQKTCYGTGFYQVCPDTTPTMSLTVTSSMDLDTTNGLACDATILLDGVDTCLIARTTITIPGGVKLRYTGKLPVVLLATDAIAISGTVDVSTRTGAAQGAGAGTRCAVPSAGTGGASGSGGGAGGSFGGHGGVGGNGASGTVSGSAYVPEIARPLSSFHTGCQGGAGGPEIAGGFGPNAGIGGGGVVLLAGRQISLQGSVLAFGAGGQGGKSGSGGAGGGSGGLIVLDAMTIVGAGKLLAQGGGGGGGGNVDTTPGSNGSQIDPNNPDVPAVGGDSATGGIGGAGSLGGEGSPGIGGTVGGGGGGGGAGVILVRGTATLTGVIIPSKTSL